MVTLSCIGPIVNPKQSVADPGSGAFLTPGSEMGKKSRSVIRIGDEHPESYFLQLRNYCLG
jgi:hypothetical protein